MCVCVAEASGLYCWDCFSAQINQSHGNNRITFCVGIKTLHKSNPLLVSNRPNSYDTREGKCLQHEQTFDLTAGHDCSTSKPIRTHGVTEWAHWWTAPVTARFPLVQFGFRYNRTLCDDAKTHLSPSLCARFHNDVTLHVGHMTFYHTHLLNY